RRRGALSRIKAGGSLLLLGNRRVQPCPPAGIEALVADVLVHPVDESVAGRERPVGILRIGSLEELGALDEVVAATLDGAWIGTDERRHRRGRKLLARHARRLQDAA